MGAGRKTVAILAQVDAISSRVPDELPVFCSELLAALERGDSVMPYERNADLPKSVRDNLPQHAQTIYRKAFNNAWDQYRDPDERRGSASREETAHRVAWAAVKESYEKRGDRWVGKD